MEMNRKLWDGCSHGRVEPSNHCIDRPCLVNFNKLPGVIHCPLRQPKLWHYGCKELSIALSLKPNYVKVASAVAFVVELAPLQIPEKILIETIFSGMAF